MKLQMSDLDPEMTLETDPAGTLAVRTPRPALIGKFIYAIPFFLRRGNLRLATWLFLSSAWVLASLITIFSGGISSPGLFLCVPLIIVAAWTLGRAASWAFTAVYLSMTLGMALLEVFGIHLPRYLPSPPIATWIVVLFLVVTAVIPLFGVVDTLHETFAKARRQYEELRRQGQNLRESEERFRTLADSAPVMIWVTDPEGKATFFNQRCLNFSGRTSEEKLGDGWTAGLHPEDRERFLPLYRSSIEARREFRSVFRLRREDGEYRWVLCTGVPRFAPDNVCSGYTGTCVDITDQKMIEERLRAGEARLMDAQRLARVGSWERDIQSGAIYWSSEMLRMLGQPNGGPLSFPAFLNYVHPKDRDKILEVDRKLHSGVSYAEVEYRIVRPDGEVRFVRSIAESISDDRGAVVRIAGATQDVTGHVKAQELLRESERRLKHAERLARVGHWQWDIRANCVSGSDEMYRLFGKPHDYTPSYKGFLEDLAPAERHRVERAIKESLVKKTGHSIEYQIAHPNGQLRTISCTWEVILDEEGSPERIFGACQDLTDARRAQEESLARQKLESIGTLASGIAHDFNNLLGGVLAQAEVALADLDAGVSPTDELHRIRDAAIRGSEIVRQLMVYAGKETEASIPAEVSSIVREMIALLEISISKHAVVKADLIDDLPPVTASPAQLRQIVMNLVTNASEAIGDLDGEIRIRTAGVTIGASRGLREQLPPGEYVQLEVADTGPGILSGVQAKVFDPFFSTKAGGRGMGLAVVQGILRRSGGAIHLTSEPGKGAAFRVLLPCANGAVSAPDSNHPATKPTSLPEAAVLVVEDEHVLREAVVKMLRKTGLVALEAADGVAALEAIRDAKARIDVIFLDLTLPGASSREIAEAAKCLRPDARLIVTSAYGVDAASAALKAKVDLFLRKPYRLDHLVEMLRQNVR